MTLGLFAPGRTTRIIFLLTLLDACLVRAIVLFLAAPSAEPSAGQCLCSSSLGRPGDMARQQASERSWKLLLAGSPDDCAGLARPSLEVLYLGKVPWSFVASLLERHAAADGASQTLL